MNQEILEAIRKSLPSIQVDLINQELGKAAKYDHLAEEYNKLKKTFDEVSKKLTELQQKESNMDSRIADANKRKFEADEIIRQQEIKMLKHELSCANQSRQEIKDLMNAAFRNPTIYKSFSRQVPLQNAGYTTSVSESETISQD